MPRAKVEAIFSDYVQLSAPHASIFEMESVQQGELGAGFFGDPGEASDEVSAEQEETQLGPLKEKRGGGKMPAPKKGPRGGSSKAAGGARRKKPAAPAAKRAKR